MARKFFSGILIVLSAIFLVLSIAGIGAIWFYNEPLTRQAAGQLREIDIELAQAQATLQSSQKELERALRIVDDTQAALEKLTQQSNSSGSLLDNIQSTLDDKLLPELKTTRQRINSARTALESLQSVLGGVSGFVPSVDLSAPGKILTDLIASAKGLDSDISDVEISESNPLAEAIRSVNILPGALKSTLGTKPLTPPSTDCRLSNAVRAELILWRVVFNSGSNLSSNVLWMLSSRLPELLDCCVSFS